MKQDSRNNYESLNPDSSAAKQTKKRIFTKGRIIALSIVIFFGVWDIFIDPPAWWRFERQQDKKAILEYVEIHYPNAKRKESSFPLQKLLGPHLVSVIYFELDGIKFAVTAEHGRLVWDGYPEARVCAQFDKIIQDGFLKPRGAKASIDYRFIDSYKESYPYTGRLSVNMYISGQGTNPRELGWLWDFYKYWKIEGESLSSYSMQIGLFADPEQPCRYISYNTDSNFPNADAFYDAFQYGHWPY